MDWVLSGIFFTLVAATPAAAPAAAQKAPRVAVMEIRALDAASRPSVELLQEVILGDLARTRRYDVIGKSDIEAMLGLERQKQLMGCSEDGTSCLAELGGALGADYVLLGSVARIDQTRRVDLKLLDATRNRVIGREFAMAQNDTDLVAQTRQALGQLMTAVPGGSAAPVLNPALAAGPPLPWLGIGTTVGGAAVALAGGVLAGVTTSDFNTRRTAGTLPVSEAAQLEGTKNLGLVGLGLGAAITGVGLWLWLSPGSTSTMAVVPTRDGVLFSLGGSL